MPKDQMYELLLQCWTVAYEKAIVDQGGMPKKIIDEACCEAVDDLTERLYRKKEYDIPEADLKPATSRRFDTMEDSIRHHIDNLTKGDMFNPNQKLDIKERPDEGKNVVEITVKNCTYEESCKWALQDIKAKEVFNPEQGLYRCQRLGCFVGAVKKYMREDRLDEDKRTMLTYLMTTIMKTTEENDRECRCRGFIYVDETMTGDKLLLHNPPEFFTK